MAQLASACCMFVCLCVFVCVCLLVCLRFACFACVWFVMLFCSCVHVSLRTVCCNWHDRTENKTCFVDIGPNLLHSLMCLIRLCGKFNNGVCKFRRMRILFVYIHVHIHTSKYIYDFVGAIAFTSPLHAFVFSLARSDLDGSCLDFASSTCLHTQKSNG